MGLLLPGTLQVVRAYSPGGPIGNNPNPNTSSGEIGDSWQQGVIGYGIRGDEVAPKQIGQEFRRNLPVMYYACDASYLNYFGSNGISAVDNAFTILNNVFTNNPTGMTNGLDGYSLSLNEFPLETRHYNYQAQALGLYDVKSVTLGAMMEQLGLADPVRYDWTLHDRASVGPIACPGDMEYLVVQRNYDPVPTPSGTIQVTPYVNNTLYSYQIFETCGPVNPFALSVPYSVDLSADTYSPVASSYGGEIYVPAIVNGQRVLELTVAPGIHTYGAFYSGLTRDDVGGLRRLMSRNLRLPVVENPDPTSLAYTTTTNIFHPTEFPNQTFTNGFGTNGGFYTFDGTFGYGDYGWLVATSKTNSPQTLTNLYPGLLVDFANSTNGLGYATNWVYTQYFTNAGYGSPVGSQILVTVSNAVYTRIPIYYTKFLNVFTNLFHPIRPTTTVYVQTTTVGPLVGSPFGTIVTNVSLAPMTVNNPSGEFFVFPPFYTNYCLPDFIGIGLTNVFATTNVVANAATNIITATNTTGFSSSASIVSIFTNYSYDVYPVTCAASAAPTNLPYYGVQKIQFIKTSYDSESGNTFRPITNSYSLLAVNNGVLQVEYFQRVVTTPDFNFAAEDLTTGPSSNPHPGVGGFARNVTFDDSTAFSGEAGPGTIVTPTTFYFNNSGPIFLNGTASFAQTMDGTPFFTETPGGDTSGDTFYSGFFVWGSFDASTNAPTIYPDGESLTNLQSQVLIQVTTTPSGPLIATNGVAYTVNFSASGGGYQPPFIWTTPGLPAGLSLVSNTDGTATISGIPIQPGTFNFILMLMDSLGRSVQWTYSITVN